MHPWLHAIVSSCPRILHPQTEDDACVEILRAVHRVGHPRADQVICEKRRYYQSKDDLRRFPDGHAECSTLVDEPETEQPVREQGTKECAFAYRVAPQRKEPQSSFFHRVERDKAECMVSEMRQKKGK